MELTKARELISQAGEKENGFQLKPVIKCLMSFIGGFVMTSPFVISQLAPFSVSLAAALKNRYSLWTCAGGILGSFVFFDGTQTVKYTAIMLLCILIKCAAARLLEAEYQRFFSYIVSFASTFIIGAAITFATGFDFEEFTASAYEGALACAGTYIFSSAAETLWTKHEPSRLTTAETAQIITAGGIMLMHLFPYSILGFSPVITVFCLLILVWAKLKNGSGGVMCGICLAFAAGLSGALGFVCAGFALGGLISGELSRRSRHACALGFFVPVILCTVADGSVDAYIAIAESLVACSVFLVIPEKFFTALSEKVNAPVPVYVVNEDSRALVKRLNGISGAFVQISDCVSTVQGTLKPSAEAQLSTAIRSTWQRVCADCDLKESCRPEIKNPSDEAVDRLAAALRDGAALDETRFPKGFYSSCYSFSDMCAQLRQRYIDFTAAAGAQGQVVQIQGVMADQFRSTAEMLRCLAEDFEDRTNINSEAADCCAAEARELGMNVITANSSLDKLGRLSLSLTVAPTENLDAGRLTDSLSNAVGTALCLPDIEETNEKYHLTFFQKQIFDVSVGACSRPVDGEQVCGDYYRSFRDENGRYIIILSDGMGTGRRAAVDSAMAAELFSRLIRSGLSFDCALSVVNSALLVKSCEESFATLDVASIDLYTGRTEFMKAGAAATFIRHRGQVAQLEQDSLPVGILKDAVFSKAESALESGDIVLMVSDGILGDCNGWIQQELKLWDAENTPQRLAEFIIGSAAERRLSRHRDDITAVAVYIK